MPAYNAERFIHQAIESILRQTYINIELLVMNDCSKDTTSKIIQSFDDSRLKIYANEKNLGYLKTCNKLFDLAQGDFVAFQDADDYSDTSRLETQMREFEKDPQLGVCGTNLTAVHENGEEMFCSYYYTGHQQIVENMLKGYFSIIPNSFLFKREILNTIGKYHEFWDRIGAEDYYWTWLIMEKYQLTNINQPLYYYRYNPEGVTGNWSDNRRKLHNRQLVPYLLNKRNETGTDPIEQKKWSEIDSFIKELDKPYIDDPSLYFKEMARRDFYAGNRDRAIKLMFKAIMKKPFKKVNYADFLYYILNK